MRASNLARVGATTIVLIVAALIATLMPSSVGTSDAAPPTSFDLSGYRAVNATPYRSLAYADNGRHFFRTGSVLCQIGPSASAAACRVKPRTAPPGVVGVAFSGETQGPYWVRPRTTFRIGPAGRFRVPTLKAGSRITVANVTCAVPRAGKVICRNWNRGFAVSRSAHRFLYPRGDRAHDGNPKVRA
ncbi:hypothetical protein [Gordonia phthalatica]|uniref:Uncharacterized protein n=1 Tax=Gordonia phthalatica TaxID=1136941 RepID=A0A0N7FV77_9ACTN|nr:hypothetical protein [Gordonia phthalatica]ALG86391.1 hypothetical protein ACH46_20215 [Gordonia phthalatica]